MKTLAARLSKISGFTVIISGGFFLLACQGGGFRMNEEAPRPATSAEPAVILQQRELEVETFGDQAPDFELESPTERESFMDDLTEKGPRHSDDDLARDAEDQFQKKHEKKREQEKREKENPPAQKPPEQPNSPQPAKPVPPPAKPPEKKTPVPLPTGPVKPGTVEPKKPAEPPAKPVEPVNPATAPSGDFCRDLNVVSGKGVADLSDLYNDDAKLVANMPIEELKNLSSDDKKNKFVCILLPIAIRMEEQVYKQRLEILRLQSKQAKSIELTKEDLNWLVDIKVAYGLTDKATFVELLSRVDIIPLPLLLTQAALESGWGRSRATKELKNLFGMHAAKGQPCAPGYDTNNACMRKFESIGDGVSAYIRLLNTGKYYQKFRDKRAQLRAGGKVLDSDVLLLTLDNYNENPAKYVRDVREIMSKSNKFTQYVFKEEEVEAGK